MDNLLIIRQKNLMSELKIRRNFLEERLLATGPNMMKVRYALHVSWTRLLPSPMLDVCIQKDAFKIKPFSFHRESGLV